MPLNILTTIQAAAAHIEAGKARKGDARQLREHAQFLRQQFLPHMPQARKIIAAPHDNGFFANFLQVLDVLALKAPDASVYVDWSPIPDATHFSYHTTGNLWDELFEQPAPRPAQPDAEIRIRINPLLTNVYKGIYWRLPVFSNDRKAYYQAFSALRIRNQRVIGRLDDHAQQFQGRHVIGIHKRVSNPGTEAMQQGAIPDTAQCIARLQAYIDELDEEYLVYLATDDLEAARHFSDHFGDRVLYLDDATRVRGGVQADGTDSEVHRRSGGARLKDAEDVIIDAWSLSHADCLWHVNSSNIPLAVSFMNPALRLYSLTDE